MRQFVVTIPEVYEPFQRRKEQLLIYARK